MGPARQPQSSRECVELYHQTMDEFLAWKEKKLSLNMARGKPSKEQLELSRGLFSALDFDQCVGGTVGFLLRKVGESGVFELYHMDYMEMAYL